MHTTNASADRQSAPAPVDRAPPSSLESPLVGLAWLMVFQSAGEVLARVTGLSLPGPMLGMVLLLLGGLTHDAVRRPVSRCAEFLLAHLSLLFIPVGVGVMAHASLLHQWGSRILLVIVLSTWVGLLVTAWVARAMQIGNEASKADHA